MIQVKAVLDFDAMLRDYYRVRGWDPDTGVPLQATLEPSWTGS